MTQESIQEITERQAEKPAYTEWLRSLKQKVAVPEEQEESPWKRRYGKT